MYCEGVDQFSGWFQSSLLLSVALNQQTPYKNLLVHGFVVDEQNRKMSKSVGNVIEPIQAIKGVQNKLPQAGLDTLRFWIAHEYYKPQIQIGPQILDKFIKRVFEVRSILRFLVGNLNDLNVENDLIDYDRMQPIDKYILNRLNDLLAITTSNYENYNLNKALTAIENFFLTELSSFYIKSVKDRLYCESKTGLKRRSAQTAVYHLLTKSLVMLGPILPHLSEEAFFYSILSKNNNSNTDYSLFRSELNFDLNKKWSDRSVDELFEIIQRIRENYFELVQSDNAATYDINLKCNKELFGLLESNGNDSSWLIECFGCSEFHLTRQDSLTSNSFKLSNNSTAEYAFMLSVEKIADKKRVCTRCKKYVLLSDGEKHVCDRCLNIISSI